MGELCVLFVPAGALFSENEEGYCECQMASRGGGGGELQYLAAWRLHATDNPSNLGGRKEGRKALAGGGEEENGIFFRLHSTAQHSTHVMLNNSRGLGLRARVHKEEMIYFFSRLLHSPGGAERKKYGRGINCACVNVGSRSVCAERPSLVTIAPSCGAITAGVDSQQWGRGRENRGTTNWYTTTHIYRKKEEEKGSGLVVPSTPLFPARKQYSSSSL